PELCKAIGQTRSGLDKLRKKDPTFPKPIKFGDTRQAAAYYVIAEVNAWLASKIEARDAA
ncbi:helix-turn-helix transcriptional regulator, partial [Escherichia coli]|uniref:helix-turn-helix transcriptional regulator n=2 Tax=Gammaproteobacteria TaxID=1236 RepID=UPI00263AC660